MGDETAEKKGGFFRKLFKITAILAAIGAVVMFWKRKQGADLDDVEWQTLVDAVGEDAAVDLLLICGWYHAISFAVNALRLPAEPGTPALPGR